MKLKSIWLTLLLALIAAPALAEDTLNTGDTAWMIVVHRPCHDDDAGRTGTVLRRHVALQKPAQHLGHDLCRLLPGQCHLDDVGLHFGLRITARAASSAAWSIYSWPASV
jgi:hypothetical protein